MASFGVNPVSPEASKSWLLRIADLTTSALLFAQFSIVPRLALLVLASGYLLTGLIVIPHALSFPGAFAPTGLLAGGAQSTAWLYHLWKVTLPTAVIVYVFPRCPRHRLWTALLAWQEDQHLDRAGWSKAWHQGS